MEGKITHAELDLNGAKIMLAEETKERTSPGWIAAVLCLSAASYACVRDACVHDVYGHIECASLLSLDLSLVWINRRASVHCFTSNDTKAFVIILSLSSISISRCSS
jgi:hypothetical protein